MSVKIHTNQNNPATWKALIVAKYAGVNVETTTVSQDDNKKPEFLEKSPLGKVPVLETAEGSISEANAIARYIARHGKNLYGNSNFEAGSIDQWIEFSANEVELPGAVWVYPILGLIPNNNNATQKAKGDIRKSLEILNKHFLTRTFLVGNRLSLADIVLAVAFVHLYQKVLDNGFRKPFVNVNRWFLTCVNQPEFKSVIGEVKLCDKMEVAKETAPVEAAKPKEQPKPKETPKPKPKPAEDEEEDEFADKTEKKKNPLDSLPPTTFDLDGWKRAYSNTDTRTEAIPYFWTNFDKQGWSIWFGDYKYNNECQKVFMTANLLGGFIQRLEKLRKYGFGTLIIFGEEPSLEVGVCFLVRGSEVPPELSEVDDYEHFNWRKADTEDVATRELINDYWAWDGSFNGKKFQQGKAYK
jgi:elongation factor 1-gamma